jgi:hypothetical protein
MAQSFTLSAKLPAMICGHAPGAWHQEGCMCKIGMTAAHTPASDVQHWLQSVAGCANSHIPEHYALRQLTHRAQPLLHGVFHH